MKYIPLFIIALTMFCIADLTWLGLIAKNLYREKLGFIMSDRINWFAAIGFYIIYISALLYFAVIPSLNSLNWQTALLNGCILGLACYATYDLTNIATIAKWPLQIVLIDITWGTFITGTIAAATHFIALKILNW